MTESEFGGEPSLVRLNKLLANAGVASRRAADEMIAAGKVAVDGVTVREHGLRVDPDTAVVTVGGVRVELRADVAHLAMNKPPGVLSTMSDDRGRPTIADYLGDWINRGQRVYHVGRLDIDSEGLLLVTNDGELAHRLTHPSYEVPKTYRAQVSGSIERDLTRRLLSGVELEDGPVRADEFRVIDVSRGAALVEIVLHEGRKHVVRRLLAEVGHPVSRLVRVAIGPVRLGHQRPGTVRRLRPDELGALYRLVGL
jgi:23S rRNA pseudouridine2605 synthase